MRSRKQKKARPSGKNKRKTVLPQTSLPEGNQDTTEDFNPTKDLLEDRNEGLQKFADMNKLMGCGG